MAGDADGSRTAGYSRMIWRRFRRSRSGVLGLLVVVLLALVGLTAPMLANRDPILCRLDGSLHAPALVDTVAALPLLGELVERGAPFADASFDWRETFDPERGDWAFEPPVPWGPLEVWSGSMLERPSSTHPLGCDRLGRDVLARLIHGTSVSISVGFISMAIATLLGLTLGGIAGYLGGWVDALISRVMEVVLCFPTFFFVLAVLAWFPPRVENVMIVLGLTRWVSIARYTRGEFLRLRELEFTQAARALGAGPTRVIFRHLLPNSLAPVLVNVTFGVSAAIIIEAGLSWLGVGVTPPQPSWGELLRESYTSIATSAHMVPTACGAIFVAVLALNLVGDAVRDAIDPRLDGGEGRR